MKVIVVPPYFTSEYLDNSLFNENNNNHYLEPFRRLYKIARNQNISLTTYDLCKDWGEYDSILVFDRPDFYRLGLNNKISNFNGKKILAILEPPVVKPHSYSKKYHQKFNLVLTWNSSYLMNSLYSQLPYFQFSYIGKYNKIPYEEKKLLVMINSNKFSYVKDEHYHERIHLIRYFTCNLKDDFDLYGYGWDSRLPGLSRSLINPINLIKYIYDVIKYEKFPSYRGTCDDKYEILAKYKYVLCLENMKNIDGYLTEKIYDCFKVGVVPVYLGCKNINAFVSHESFIKYQIGGYQELLENLKFISKKDYQYYQLKGKDEVLKVNHSSSISDNWAKIILNKFIDDQI
jgi:hypothetical protein